jgi:hypothetical protein
MRKLAIIFALCCLTLPCRAAVSCFASTKASGTGAVTSAINTTGASGLYAVFANYTTVAQGNPYGIKDSQNNIWLNAPMYGGNSRGNTQIFFAPNPSTSATHTFTILGTFPSVAVFACSGTSTTYPFAGFNGYNGPSGGTTWQPGSVTPVEAGDLIIVGGSANSATSTPSCDSGFSSPVFETDNITIAVIEAYLVAPNTSAVNPTCTVGSAAWSGAIAVFPAAGATPPVNPAPLSMVTGGTGYPGSSCAAAAANIAQLQTVGEIVVDSFGDPIFADVNANQICMINKQSASYMGIAAGAVGPIAGNGTLGYTVNVAPLSGEFAHPVGLAIDSSNCVYVADQQNGVVDKFCPTGNLTTVAGLATGLQNSCTGGVYTGAGGLATLATLPCPQGVALDSAKNIYIAVSNAFRIVAVNVQGTTQTLLGTSIGAGNIKTIGGTGSGLCSTSGTANVSFMGAGLGIGFDCSGNLLTTCYNNHRVLKISTAGVLSLVAGNGTAGCTTGTATTSEITNPFDVKVSCPSGKILIADAGCGTIDLVDPASGNLSHVAGDYSLFGGLPADYAFTGLSSGLMGFGYIVGVTPIPGTDNFYVGDFYNNKIYEVYGGALPTAHVSIF